MSIQLDRKPLLVALGTVARFTGKQPLLSNTTASLFVDGERMGDPSVSLLVTLA